LTQAAAIYVPVSPTRAALTPSRVRAPIIAFPKPLTIRAVQSGPPFAVGKIEVKMKLTNIRNKMGFIPEAFFENEPAGPPPKPPSKEPVKKDEPDKYRPGDEVGGY
jgi:hypothetical protein